MHSIASKRVLVTGATGFIGRHLVLRLIDERCDVTCMVRATSRVDGLRDMGASITTCTLADSAAVERALRHAAPEVVFHVAGAVRAVTRADFAKANADAVASIASACAGCDPPPVLLLVSSLAAAGPCAGDRPRTEEDPPAPVSYYGRSKLAGEHAAFDYANRIPITIVRPPIVFGPGDHGVLQMMRPIARFGIHVVPRRGALQLSFIYIDDLVEGLIRAAVCGERARAHAHPGSGIYFLGSDEHPTLVDFGRMIADAVGRTRMRIARVPTFLLRSAGRFGDFITAMRHTPTWINSDKVTEALAGSWICSSSKAQSQLNWRASTSIRDALHITAEAHREAGFL